MEARCATCVYSRKPYLYHNSSTDCQRRPPVVMVDEAGKPWQSWPIVMLQDWCGEWQDEEADRVTVEGILAEISKALDVLALIATERHEQQAAAAEAEREVQISEYSALLAEAEKANRAFERFERAAERTRFSVEEAHRHGLADREQDLAWHAVQQFKLRYPNAVAEYERLHPPEPVTGPDPRD